MLKMRIMLSFALVAVSVCGCEQFQRFEAWKRETFLGEPPQQAVTPTYPMYGYQQRPAAAPVAQAAPNYAQAAPNYAPAYAALPYPAQNYAAPAYPAPTTTASRSPAAIKAQPAAMVMNSAAPPQQPSGMPPMAQPVAQPILVPAAGE